MAWILLIIAGLFEIGWPLGFKLASMHSKYFIWFIGLSILSMGLSGYFLYLAQKKHPDRYGLCNLDRDRGYRDCSSWNLVLP